MVILPEYSYDELKKANAQNKRDIGAIKELKSTNNYIYRIDSVDFGAGYCIANTKKIPIGKIVDWVMNGNAYVTNIGVISTWTGLIQGTCRYRDNVLNRISNRVLASTAGMFSKEGLIKALKLKFGDSQNSQVYLESFKEDLMWYMQKFYSDIPFENDTICYIMKKGSEQKPDKVAVGVLPRISGWNDVFGCYGCTDYAYYVDNNNLKFRGIMPDGELSTGTFRRVKRGKQLTPAICKELKTMYQTGNVKASAVLSEYTESLKPLVDKYCKLDAVGF